MALSIQKYWVPIVLKITFSAVLMATAGTAKLASSKACNNESSCAGIYLTNSRSKGPINGIKNKAPNRLKAV